MSRNVTCICVRHDGLYRDFSTIKAARRFMAGLTGEIAWWRERYTPSGDASGKAGLRRRWRKQRNLRRREADAKKREELDAIWFMTIPCGERVARRMSVRQFRRYLFGVRRGTIL